MARIVLNPFGSFGDLHPYLAIALELKRRGHAAVIGTSEVYRAKVQALGLEFVPVRPDVGELLNQPKLLRDIWHPRRATAALLRDYLLPAVEASHADLLPACRHTDLLLAHGAAFAGPVVAEQLGMPWLSVALQPLMFLSAQDRPALMAFPFLQWRPSAALYPWLFAFVRLLSKRWAEPIRRLRQRSGLPAPRRSLFDDLFSPYGTLALFSSHYAAPQPDWPPKVTVCGFAFYDHLGPEAQDLTELETFLAAGEPPVLFTLGSSAVLQAGSFYHESRSAIESMGKRAVLLTGIQARNQVPPSKNICLAPYAPFSTLMPRCAASVHQGGIGTTAHALRSGRPMIVAPWAHDQPDNARRIRELGAGCVLSRSRYTSANIQRELRLLLEDGRYAATAQQLGRAIAQEDGARTACDVIERLL